MTRLAGPELEPGFAAVDQLAEVVAYGNSIPGGAGASGPTLDMMTRIASELGAKERTYAKNGAVLSWTNVVAQNQYGVVGMVLHTVKRPTRPAARLTAAVAAGVATIPVTPAPNGASVTGPLFAVDQLVWIGTGDPGATGGEFARIKNITATNLDLDGFEGVENTTGTVRAHAINDPVYVMPSHWGASNTIYILCEAQNQMARYGEGVYPNAKRWYQDALRMILSRLRSAEVFEPDHPAIVFGGPWGAAIFDKSVSGSFAAQGARNPTAVNATATLNLPDSYDGSPVSFNGMLVGGGAGGGVWTFTLDGGAAGNQGTLTTVATPTTPLNKEHQYCKRFTFAPGRHVFEAKMTTFEANNLFDCFVVESQDPPVVQVFKSHRLPAYDGNAAIGSYEYGHIRPLLAAVANVGDTFVSVNQSPVSYSRQLLAGSVPKVGEYLVINPRSRVGVPYDPQPSTELVRKVTSVTGTGPFIINFTKLDGSAGNLENSYPIGTRVELGGKDWDTRNVINKWIDDVGAEFDKNVVLHDPDTYLLKQEKYFHKDRVHFNDLGAAVVAEKAPAQLRREPRLNARLAARLARPVPRPVLRIDFLNVATAQALALTNSPAGTWEFPLVGAGASNYRRPADWAGGYMCRIGLIQTVIGATGQKIRLQYSPDQGANFRHVHRVVNANEAQATGTNWVEPTAATDAVWGEIDLGAALPTGGLKTSQWGLIYPEALMDGLILRFITIGGNGVADAAIQALWLDWW